MKNQTEKWLSYADDNLESAKLLLKNGYLNPCLQNVQQSIEKFLKALIIEFSLTLIKTHSIQELKTYLLKNGFNVKLTSEACNLIDSVYIPSKYPLGSALPDSTPNEEICKESIKIAEEVKDSAESILSDKRYLADKS